MNISLKNLKLVNVIVKEGSVTKAAEKLFLSQPALSHQLKKMEEEIGIKVFNRMNKKLLLTEAGQVLFNTSEEMLASFAQLNNKIEQIKNGKKRVIRLSTECYTTYHWLPNVIQEYKKENNDVSIEIVIEATKDPLIYLTEGKIDLAIVSSVIDHPSIHFRPLVQDEMVVVLSKENDLLQNNTIDLSNLKEQNLILYDISEEKNYVLNHILQQNKGFVNSIQKVQLTEAIIQLVRANLGISIMAKWSVQPFLQDGQLTTIPLKSKRGIREWYLASLNEISEVELGFIDQVKFIFNK
ncbi:LysR family transcriptional regulator [Aquimarina sp. 2201CG5-10]|uniref:LysR family transcriptional regulator n=1 Tax=Aquimarina callyspongiae TaxID=3098150 RepID=UPI002AB53C47|nr:LysR family transcriptional regulator [Aquimarina sp. 2201CG5-10]MDY8138412.1 LysR family transcriptional regulator [Aquimarina sp. 2201CG5-10]